MLNTFIGCIIIGMLKANKSIKITNKENNLGNIKRKYINLKNDSLENSTF